jgi:hypothetical protein
VRRGTCGGARREARRPRRRDDERFPSADPPPRHPDDVTFCDAIFHARAAAKRAATMSYAEAPPSAFVGADLLRHILACADEPRAVACAACVARAWREAADAERQRLLHACIRALGAADGAAFHAACFSADGDPQARRQAGARFSSRLEYARHRARCLAALRADGDAAAPGGGARLLAAHAHVQANARRFRGAVYGPLLTEVAFEEPFHAAWLWQQCAPFAWASFLATCAQDTEALLVDMARFGTCVVFCAPCDDAHDAHADDVAETRRGVEEACAGVRIVGDAASLVHAPCAVRRCLSDMAGLHQVLVAHAQRAEDVAALLDARPRVASLLATLPAEGGDGDAGASASRVAWVWHAGPRAGELLPRAPRAARLPDVPPLLRAALGRRDAWCSGDAADV